MGGELTPSADRKVRRGSGYLPLTGTASELSAACTGTWTGPSGDGGGQCTSSESVCPKGCADLQTDANNCGSCICGSGSCLDFVADCTPYNGGYQIFQNGVLVANTITQATCTTCLTLSTGELLCLK